MSINSALKKTLGYVTEAALEVFSPNHDNYPSVGLQPFSGDSWRRRKYRSHRNRY